MLHFIFANAPPTPRKKNGIPDRLGQTTHDDGGRAAGEDVQEQLALFSDRVKDGGIPGFL